MKTVLAEIKVLEQKIAETYESYKKRHPKTKKTPNDPMFQTTNKQKPVGDSAAAGDSEAASNFKKIKKKPLDHALRNSWTKGDGMSAKDHEKASEYHHSRDRGYEKKMLKTNLRMDRLNREGDPDYELGKLQREMDKLQERRDYHRNQDDYHSYMAKGINATDEQTELKYRGLAHQAKGSLLRTTNPYTGEERSRHELNNHNFVGRAMGWGLS